MITLNDIRIGRANKVDQFIIDEFVRKSELLAAMPFDNTLSPNSGSTLIYGYKRLTSSPAAEGRAIGSEYTPSEAKKELQTTELQVMGGAYEIDRVLNQAAPDEVAMQAEEKVKATVNRFHYLFINGNKDNTNEYDGLAEIVNGTSTDLDGSSIDLSTMSSANAIKITEALDTAILAMNEKPDFIMANGKTIVKLKSAARMLGYISPTEDAFGRPTEGYNGIRFLDLGRYYNSLLGSDSDIIGINDASGKSSIYLVKLSASGTHGLTIAGDKSIQNILPDFTTAGAVKKGEVEFVAGLAVKNSRSIARIKDVQVQATLSTLGALSLVVNTNLITVTPSKPKIGNKYYYIVSNASISAPTANTAINTSTYTALPANGVVVLSANDFARVVEVDSASLLPIATGQEQFA